MRIIYITHPQVTIDANIDVPKWGLSGVGEARAIAFAKRALLKPNTVFISSAETKAIELATHLATTCNGHVETDENLGENDRSSTGYLPADEFEEMADQFFASPEMSVQGWERALDAQTRIVDGVQNHVNNHQTDHDLVFCGHGAVGTLLLCHIGKRDIRRIEDQPAGGGNVFQFSLAPNELLCEWTPMEEWIGFVE